jgi:hypothetical protein
VSKIELTLLLNRKLECEETIFSEEEARLWKFLSEFLGYFNFSQYFGMKITKVRSKLTGLSLEFKSLKNTKLNQFTNFYGFILINFDIFALDHLKIVEAL